MNSIKGNNLRSGVATYCRVGVQTTVETASPHRLIQMLLDGAVAKIHAARGYMERGETVRKCEHIDWSLAIIEGLKSSLDLNAGGEIAQNLDALYEYMMRQLALANLNNEVAKLEEVSRLLNDIRAGWNGIANEQSGASAAHAG